MMQQKLTKVEQGIFREAALNTGKPINLSRIADKLSVSVPAVAKAVSSLELKKLIQKTKVEFSAQVLVSLNVQNKYVIAKKRVFNLAQLYDSGFVDVLEEKFPGTTIVLFGSYSRGEDTIHSDIDIAIIGCKDKETHFETFEKLFERKLSFHFFEKMNMHKYLKENICNGIVLAGGISL